MGVNLHTFVTYSLQELRIRFHVLVVLNAGHVDGSHCITGSLNSKYWGRFICFFIKLLRKEFALEKTQTENVMKSRKMILKVNVAGMGQNRNTYRIFVGKLTKRTRGTFGVFDRIILTL